ncbi:hypothetical protein K432DRAFT_311917 [Lepidopterella palustris CBS 459.81]|uniref:Uncharacterized protein n=1 Tax=Lepidopterella palustris CBS 459.81 TaxID=1314670 RepID=A0A8E2DYB8_9PEZI|nr:hypothetical protein K432DRAFT_311917 [Lepidopterella palustris CBS 459.81]
MHSFRPNCTFPHSKPPGFIYGPNIRSTVDIVWSCTSIIILSTWSTLHLTVPPDTNKLLQHFLELTYCLKRKLIWMGIMLMFPEYLLTIGAANLFVAWQNHVTLEELADNDKVPWSKTHTFHTDMGGIAIRFLGSDHLQHNKQDESDDIISSKPPKSDLKEKSEKLPDFLEKFQKAQESKLTGPGKTRWQPDVLHSKLASEFAELADKSAESVITKANHIAPFHGHLWILDSNQLVVARQHGIIEKLPYIRPEQIKDKSKSDGLVQLISVIQVLWLVLQVVVRRWQHLSSSALEFSTLAFCSCAFFIYLIEWKKPKDVSVPIYVDTYAVVSLESFKAIAKAAPTVFMQHRFYSMPQSCHIVWFIVAVTILSTTLFGGIHLLAWNITFPTPVERVLWRTAALLVTIIPSICALLVLMENHVSGTTHRLGKWSSFVFAPFYFSSRAFLIVESFRTLYFLPSDTLAATWVTYAPHVG